MRLSIWLLLMVISGLLIGVGIERFIATKNEVKPDLGSVLLVLLSVGICEIWVLGLLNKFCPPDEPGICVVSRILCPPPPRRDETCEEHNDIDSTA